jgi:hypothetical protein
MDISPAREANDPLATPKITNNLWNTVVYYRIHESSPLISILSPSQKKYNRYQPIICL